MKQGENMLQLQLYIMFLASCELSVVVVWFVCVHGIVYGKYIVCVSS